MTCWRLLCWTCASMGGASALSNNGDGRWLNDKDITIRNSSTDFSSRNRRLPYSSLRFSAEARGDNDGKK